MRGEDKDGEDGDDRSGIGGPFQEQNEWGKLEAREAGSWRKH